MSETKSDTQLHKQDKVVLHRCYLETTFHMVQLAIFAR